MTKFHSDALDLLRARFPESEGWTYTSAKYFEGWRVEVFLGDDDEVLLSAKGATEEDAFAALIAAWDAATHAEKVRDLVRRVEEVQEIAEDRGDVQDGPEGQPIPNSWMVAGTMLREALAALPEHWKEVPRGK